MATARADDSALHFARESLTAFAIGSADARGQTYDVGRHLRLIARELMAVEAAIRRGESRHVMIFAPPRHGKTELVSKYFTSWFLGRNPGRSVMAASYGQDLADDNGRKVLDTIRDPFFQTAFPEAAVRPDSKSVSRFGLTGGGTYYGVGAGGALTGRGADLLVIDDPIKGSEEAFSESVRKKKQEWFIGDAYSRRAPGAGVILMNTRWHEDDLAGFCLRELGHLGWHVISLPAIAEPTVDAPDPLGRATGEALWPERFPLSFLDPIRKAGSYWWSALYQQRPQPETGGMLKRGWWNYYGGKPDRDGFRALPARFDEIVISWDCTFKDSAGTDYVVGTVWGRLGVDYFLLDLVRDRMDFPTTVTSVLALAEKWPRYNACLIEDKANGPAVIATLQRKLPRLVAVNPEGGKVARAAAVAGLVEGGNVWLPHASIAPWVLDFISECAAFPTGKHDDQVDSATQALIRMSTVARPARGTIRTWGLM
jgi:predicted phage terminase large subunit-like protein